MLTNLYSRQLIFAIQFWSTCVTVYIKTVIVTIQYFKKLESLQQQLWIIFSFRVQYTIRSSGFYSYSKPVYYLLGFRNVTKCLFSLISQILLYMYIIINKYQFSVRNTAASLGQSSDSPHSLSSIWQQRQMPTISISLETCQFKWLLIKMLPSLRSV